MDAVCSIQENMFIIKTFLYFHIGHSIDGQSTPTVPEDDNFSLQEDLESEFCDIDPVT